MANFKADIHDWWSAQSFLRGTPSRKLAHNTYVQTLGTSDSTQQPIYGVLYHRTIVVQYYFDTMYKLNSGGWKTSTTKERINKCLPPEWSLWQDKHEWYIGVRESSRAPGRTWVFEDNMVLHYSDLAGHWIVKGAELHEPKHPSPTI